MLETIDLSAKLPKEEFKALREALNLRLAQLHRDVAAARIPVLVVFEGWKAAGIGTVIGRLLYSLDPRGYKLYNVCEPTAEEALRPPMWRFWTSIPKKGAIVVYDGSWYGPVLRERHSNRERVCERIRIFERQMTDDGAVVAKFWLQVSKEEQVKRFKKMEKDRALSWKVTEEDWRVNRKYADYSRVVEEVLGHTSTAYAPWTVVPAHDDRYAMVQVAETLANAMEQALKRKPESAPPRPTVAKRRTSPLDRVDLSVTLDRKKYDKQLPKLQDKLARLENLIYVPRIPVVIVYEGWDASGKGGNIKRLISGLDHRGVEVVPIGAPEGDEKTHHYLWRFWKNLPKAGHITVFDRSWYGRVLVERVEGFATPAEWQRAYQEINEFEEELTSYGTVLVKFWIHISKDEQLRRFKSRQETPEKNWKITEEDWRNRERWADYYAAVSDMIEKTSTGHAPWTIIEGNDKPYARVKAVRTVADAIAEALKKRG